MNWPLAALRRLLGLLYGSAPETRGDHDGLPGLENNRRQERNIGPHPANDVLLEIEQIALETYAAHNLPTRQGEYGKGPRGKVWKFIGESLSAEERWSLALEKGSTAGWQFMALEDLGSGERDASGDLARASDMLRTCKALRSSLQVTMSLTFPEDVERAIRLGASWHRSQLLAERKDAGGLRFKVATGRRRQPSGAKSPASQSPL